MELRVATGLLLSNFRALATLLHIAQLGCCIIRLVAWIELLHTIDDLVVNELGRANKLDVSSVFDFGHSVSVSLLISLLLLLELLLDVLEDIIGFVAGACVLMIVVVV